MPNRRKSRTISRFVSLGSYGRRQAFGSPDKDATFTFLTLGPRNPVRGKPQRDAGYSNWSVTGTGYRRHGLTPNNADAHYTHISPIVQI